MRGGTLFSGICAPETACPEIDWRWRAEIDPFANAVAEYRHPGIPNLGNVEEIDPDATEPVDLVVFGSPCQSFSVAGKRLGLDDPRGNLALVALSLIGRLKPAWFVFENVPGLLSSDGGRDFGALLGVMGELGYGFAYRVLDAQFFGVPQRRRRVFVVGYLGDWRPPAAVLFERESLSGNPPPRREAGKRIADSLTVGANQYSGFQGEPVETIARCLNAHPSLIDGESETFIPVAPPLTRNPYGDHESREGLLVAHSLRADGFDASEDGTGRGTPLVPVPIDMRQASRGGRFTNNRREGSSGGAPGTGIGNPGDPCPTLADSHTPAIAFSCKDHGADASDIAPTLRAMPHDGSHANAGGQVAVAISENQRAEIRETPYVRSLDTQGGKPGQGYPAARVGMAVRRLTPRECERLQGFPDDYTLVPYRGKPAADGPRYRALGNSMAVPVMHWILSRVLACDALLQERAAA